MFPLPFFYFLYLKIVFISLICFYLTNFVYLTFFLLIFNFYLTVIYYFLSYKFVYLTIFILFFFILHVFLSYCVFVKGIRLRQPFIHVPGFEGVSSGQRSKESHASFIPMTYSKITKISKINNVR